MTCPASRDRIAAGRARLLPSWASFISAPPRESCCWGCYCWPSALSRSPSSSGGPLRCRRWRRLRRRPRAVASAAAAAGTDRRWPSDRRRWSLARVGDLAGATVSGVTAAPSSYDRRTGSTRLAQFGVLERGALGPPRRPGEFVEERDVVGAFRRLAHHFVDLVSVRPDENAPAIGLDAVEDDGRGLCRAGQRL